VQILELNDVHYSVRPHFWKKNQAILKGVSFNVHEGQIFGFLGPNGAGKTTSLKAALGLITPQQGEITILGGSIKDRQLRAQIGFMPEHPIFPDHLSSKELLLQHGLLAGLRYRDARKQTESILDKVNLTYAADRKLRHYSKGMLQRTGLAQAIIGSPRFILLDEPMGGVDPIGRREIREIMTNLRDQGTTILFSTHILPDVEMICDNVGILIDGAIRRTGTPNQLTSDTHNKVDIIATKPSSPLQSENLPFSLLQSSSGNIIKFQIEDSKHTHAAIDCIREAGGNIQAIQQIRQSLEELFMTEIQTPSPSAETPHVQ